MSTELNLSTKKDYKRNLGLDLLRIISMFMVLLLHILGQGGVLNALDSSSPKYAVAWFIEIAAYCAVNCYALISGYVGIRSKYKYSNIAFLWIQTVFYTLLITLIFSIFKHDELTANSYWTAVLPVTKRAYWYFTSYFCIFFFIPAFNHIVNTMKKAQLKAMIISIIVIFSLIYTLARSNIIGSAVDDLFVTGKGYSPIWLALLYVVGAYISKYCEDFKMPPYLCFVLYFVSIIITLIEHLTVKKSVLVGYTSPTILFCGIILLIGFSQLKINKLGGIISFFAPLSFSVYLIHVNPLVWKHFMKDRFTEIAALSLPQMVLCILITAVCLYLICSAIDLIRHYLFKLLKLKHGLMLLENKLIKDLWNQP